MTLVSVFSDEVESFDNEDSFSDLKFVIGGLEKPLLLHKRILAKGSSLVQKIMKCKQTAESNDRDMVVWPFDTKKAVDRQCLVKAPRYLYGDTVVVELKDGECCAMISTFTRLQMKHLDEVITKLAEFAVKGVTNDVKDCAELLVQMQDYPECFDRTICKLEQSFVDVVLTSKNLCENYDIVVNKCLMALPPRYLDFAHFGAPHTQFSEFHVRAQYVKTHKEEMNKEEKQGIVMKCDWTKLDSAEMKELDKLSIFSTRFMMSVYQTVLENTEKERDIERKQNQIRTEALESIIQENSSLNLHMRNEQNDSRK